MQATEPTYQSSVDETVPRTFLETARFALRQYGFLGTVARFLLMREDMKRFVRGAKDPEETAFRKDLLRKFAAIQKHVTCAHSPYQFVLMAEFLLNLQVAGPLVECGCFKGGSTAKLSLLAKRTGRRLVVCDSFEGLPPPESERERLLTAHGDHPNYELAAGEFRGALDEVKENVRRYGCLDVCEFVPGFFQQSLPDLDIRPAFVFIDVDYASSARECLKHLWPRLEPEGLWFTHEATFPQYLSDILDAEFWQLNFGECPPVLMGGGSGLALNAASIAYFRKPARA
jgi:hypothetical protein